VGGEVGVPSFGRSQHNKQRKQGVCHTVALPIKLKHILRQRRITKTPNISPHKNIIIKKSSKRNQNPSRYYYTSIITNLKFQHKPKYHLSKILI